MPPRDELQETEALHAKAAKAELEGGYDRAFQLYIKAAEGFLHLSRTATDPALRAACKTNAGKVLERAEKIKTAKRDITPVATDYLSHREQLLVLQKSSNINGVYYPIWTDDSASAHSNSPISQPQPALSQEQTDKCAVWRRITDSKISEEDGAPLSPEDIVQHVVSDCSVCASVALCIEHNRRFSSRLATSVLYPQDGNGMPVASADGRYYLRLFINGAYRHIDEQLPTYPNGVLMCMSTGQKRILWPSLVEKAYMKLMGGYEFPGSLSSTDLHTLTGWIPEYVDLTSPDFQREKTWRKIYNGFTGGLCMLTVGTGHRLSIERIGPLSLLPVHCYAVTNITNAAEERTMTILDTWVGTSSEGDDADFGMNKLSLENSQRSRSHTVSWDTICSHFEGLYLNWNPKLFEHSLTFHGAWKKQTAVEASYPRHFQLQLKMSHNPGASKQRDVWILLTRHLVDSRRSEEYISLSVRNDSFAQSDVMSVKGEYTNGTHVLVKTEYSSAQPMLSVVASYDGPHDDVGFTITAYASRPISWEKTPSRLLYRETVAGAFTTKTAGGNPMLPTFMLNPQYHIRVHPDKAAGAGRGPKANFLVTLQADRHIPLSMLLVWSQGQRITEVVESEVIASTGSYNFGYASFSQAVPPGDYALVVSAFEPRYIGPFTLHIDSSLRFDVSPIAQEGAGMFNKVIQDAWTQATAAGGPSFKNYTKNPVFKLEVQRQTQLIVRLQLLLPPSTATSINVTLFKSSQTRGLGPHVTTSGPYSDAASGAVTPQITLQPGTYYIIPSTFNPGIQTEFKMLVYTSASGVSASRAQLSK